VAHTRMSKGCLSALPSLAFLRRGKKMTEIQRKKEVVAAPAREIYK
jgi:hypothetical protein